VVFASHLAVLGVPATRRANYGPFEVPCIGISVGRVLCPNEEAKYAEPARAISSATVPTTKPAHAAWDPPAAVFRSTVSVRSGASRGGYRRSIPAGTLSQRATTAG